VLYNTSWKKLVALLLLLIIVLQGKVRRRRQSMPLKRWLSYIAQEPDGVEDLAFTEVTLIINLTNPTELSPTFIETDLIAAPAHPIALSATRFRRIDRSCTDPIE
jgi:hypothetical protein